MKKPSKRAAAAVGVAAACAGLVGTAFAVTGGATAAVATSSSTATPIKHLVVIFDENVSYDHYFATYPKAANTDGPSFTGKPSSNNNLVSSKLLTKNPNSVQPFRLKRSQATTCDQNHSYGPEQKAVNGGKMDQFVQTVSTNAACGSATQYGADGLTMGYYDGNTVTGLWNYAQNYAMSDNSWDATFGPSTPGALNLVSGQTHGVTSYAAAGLGADNSTADADNTSENPVKLTTPDSYTVVDPDADGVGTVTNDPDPVYDDCNNGNHKSANAVGGMSGKNIGDLLNQKNITWGWFQGGFTPTTAYNASTGAPAVCGATSVNVAGGSSLDYSPHHNPFEYYKSTSNPHHLPPTPGVAIGAADPTGANHQYDLSYFDEAADNGQLPAVSFLKASEFQDGHASYSDPVDEQHFIVHTINELQKSPEWSSTAVVISYDDSDGWYDHVAPTILNGSNGASDEVICSSAAATTAPLGGYSDRCGPSQRLPLMVISPYSKANFVDHTETTQPSVAKFIEDNWLGGARIGDGSFDATAGSINNMFDFKSAPRTGALVLRANGTVVSNATAPKAPGKPAPTTKPTPPAGPSAALTKAKKKLAKDKKALAKAKKKVKKKHGAAKKAAQKKVKKLKKKVKKDKRKVKAAA